MTSRTARPTACSSGNTTFSSDGAYGIATSATVTRRTPVLSAAKAFSAASAEVREFYGLPDFAHVPPTQTELELVWGINSRIFYFGVRKYIYGMAVPENLDTLIEAEVRTFFDGVGPTLKEIVQRPPTARRLRSVAAGRRR